MINYFVWLYFLIIIITIAYRLPSGFGHGVLGLLLGGIGSCWHPLARHPLRARPTQEGPDAGQHPLRQGEYELSINMFNYYNYNIISFSFLFLFSPFFQKKKKTKIKSGNRRARAITFDFRSCFKKLVYLFYLGW